MQMMQSSQQIFYNGPEKRGSINTSKIRHTHLKLEQRSQKRWCSVKSCVPTCVSYYAVSDVCILCHISRNHPVRHNSFGGTVNPSLWSTVRGPKLVGFGFCLGDWVSSIRRPVFSQVLSFNSAGASTQRQFDWHLGY